ncbi:MAG TPA: response regulator [Terriglobales bacterium]|nr:response regulator [Terriglobales bacterium]
MRTREVLVVDDNPADIDLTQDALLRCHIPLHIHSVPDGVEALALLQRTGKYSGVAAPDLVILDLNMPGKDGRAVLSEVKSNPGLRRTPVVIFSTSQASRDIGRSYELGANSYVSKPVNLRDYIAAIVSIGNYWLGCAHLPPQEEV